jgi:NAD(P)-dependent dehydrogenase (short-subunit alcohol dehydrogenase family)
MHMKKVVIVGGTGYIGKYVVKESVKRGYDTTVVIRPGGEPKADYFAGAKLVYADVCDQDSIKSVISEPVDAVVSCLASSNICTRTPLPFLSLPPSPPPTQTHECTFVHTLAHTFAHYALSYTCTDALIHTSLHANFHAHLHARSHAHTHFISLCFISRIWS